MALDQDLLDEDFQAILADLEDKATFSAVEFTVNRTMISREFLNLERGSITDYVFTLIFRFRDFAEKETAEPIQGNTITFEGVVYRILSTDKSPDGIGFRTHMGAKFTKNERR